MGGWESQQDMECGRKRGGEGKKGGRWGFIRAKRKNRQPIRAKCGARCAIVLGGGICAGGDSVDVAWLDVEKGGVGLVVYDGSMAVPLPAGRPAQLLPPCTHTPPMSPPTLLPPEHSTTKRECMGKETTLVACKAQLHSRGTLRTSPKSKMGPGRDSSTCQP